MADLPVVDLKGKKVGTVSVQDSLFENPASDHLVWEVVMHYLANRRQGTSKVKGRAEVSGGGRKPWRQKGTGRARVGSLRSPVWVGGGTVHGPQPRSYRKRMPRKKKKTALRRVLGDYIRDAQVIVVDSLQLESHKTREFASALACLGVPRKTLIVDTSGSDNLFLAARNIPGISVRRAQDVNAYDLLLHEHVTISKEGLEVLKEAVAS